MTDVRAALGTRFTPTVPAVLAGATVLSHIVWVLLPQQWRPLATITAVVLFFSASATHAAISRGPRWTIGYLAITLGLGWGVEALGTTTSWPFGGYSYSGTLGPQLGPVPVVVPLAWAMMAYPVLVAAQRIWHSKALVALWGGAVMMAWDLFLDPQMVAEGHWTWADPSPHLPGIDEIPAQNFLGWFLTATLMIGLLTLIPPGSATAPADLRSTAVPVAMLAWVYLSNVMANAVFFGRPTVALWGGIVMGALLLPWFASLRAELAGPR